ncbi:MAG: type 12 methyltransferase [Herpetosiphonaceae bacterium]|nr:MAG: type 12 methyltransferase [Herpetosiphonaceae bacterium]
MDLYDTFARYYDADVAGFSADIAVYRDLARQTGGPILELMCGSGRILLPLALEGYTLTGVDLAAPMLELARARLAAAGLTGRVTLIHGDARSVALPGPRFAMAILAFNSFSHMEQIADQLAVLAVARRALKRNGLLVIDLLNIGPAQLAAAGSPIPLASYQLDDRHISKTVIYRSDPAMQINDVTFHYEERTADGATSCKETHFRMRWFNRFEIEHLLARAGFTVRGIYGSYDFTPYTAESPLLLVIASPASKKRLGGA